MSDSVDYGKNLKRIVFTDTDHRHAQLVIKLKNDGITQAKFFRAVPVCVGRQRNRSKFVWEVVSRATKKLQTET